MNAHTRLLKSTAAAAFPDKAKMLFRSAPYKVMHGGRGGSKCLGLGTKVIMADGSLKAVENIKIGEKVMGPDSKPRTVLSTCIGRAPLYKVKQTSGIEYVVNDAHILSLKKSKSAKNDKRISKKTGKARNPRGRYPDWPEITNINVELAASQSRRWREHFRGYRAGLVDFPAQKVGIDPYFLGVWLGDGLHRELMITNMDQEIIDYCKLYTQGFGLGFSARRGSSGAAIDMTFPPIGRRDNPLWTQFKFYLLVSNKHIPHAYLANSENVRLELLAGLIDTDGSKHGNCYHISQTNETLARQIKYLADTLGFRTSLVKRKTICTNNQVAGETWAISISGNAWRIPCRVERKKINRNDVRPNKDFLLSQIEIEPIGIGDYAGFSIDGDHLFLLEDGTVTHNTWDFCRALLILASRKKLFVLCAREIQKSIRDSVHKLLSDQINEMGLGWFYRILDTKIIGLNGSEFVFYGIRTNTQAIKSIEAIDICAVFEATFVSRSSWEILLPTVRRDAPHGPFGKGSEVWVEFNPELDTDYTYQFWVVDPPAGTLVEEINWRDNPWFPRILMDQKNDLEKRDYDAYLTVWEGKTRKTLQGAIYAKEISAAIMDKRIGPHVRWDKALPVDVSFDLGKKDMCAMCFWQQQGDEHRIFDFYGNVGLDFAHYLEQIQQRKYLIRTIYLPHDAEADHISANKTVAQQAREAYPGDGRVRVVPRIPAIMQGINMVRTMFPRILINDQACADLMLALQHYQYEVDPDTNERSNYPLHDWSSNPCDSLRTYVEGLRAVEKPIRQPVIRNRGSGYTGQSWMQ